MKPPLVLSCLARSLVAPGIVAGEPADKNIGSYDCTFTGKPRHACNSEVFAKALLSARTVAVLTRDDAPPWPEAALTIYRDNRTSVRECNRLRDLYFDRFLKPQVDKKADVAAAREDFLKQTTAPTAQKILAVQSSEKASLHGVMGRGPIVFSDKDSDSAEEFVSLLEKWGRYKIVLTPTWLTWYWI